MKTKLASLLVVLILTTTQCMAQRTIRVEAQNDDISNNLDLQAVSSIFGESRNLEDFERRLNDYDSQISNLDLNDDGEVDYLRVIESSEDNVHVVVVQAVLDRDVFQDVATIVVERSRNSRAYVQVIGDSYLYGDNYIIEPVYIHTPSIFSFFWGNRYRTWHSPYYWGYYPRYYRYREPFEVDIYLSHIHRHINYNHQYHYSDRLRNERAYRIHSSISRNDYGSRYPSRSFGQRNENIRNKHEFDSRNNVQRRGVQSRETPGVNRNSRGVTPSRDNNQRNVTPSRDNRNSDMNRSNSNQRNVTPSRDNRNSDMNRENSNQRSVTPSRDNRNSDMNRENSPQRNVTPSRDNRNSVQTRPSTERSNSSESRSRVTREDNNSRSTPSVNKTQRSEPRQQVERKQTESNRSSNSRSDNDNRNNNKESNRR